MAVTAPKCNVTVFTPAANPFSPHGFRTLPPNATLTDVIKTINDNVAKNEEEFNRLLAKDIAKPTSSGFKTAPSQVKKAAEDQIKKIYFKQKAIIRKKMRVTNPEDKSQYIIDDRVVALVMADKTGAVWVFEDKLAAKGISAGSEELIVGEGG